MADTDPTVRFMAREPKAVDNAFAVIQAIAEMGPGVTTRQLNESLPMSRASIYRILKHLVTNEYLVRTPDLSGFALGARVNALVESAVANPRGRHPVAPQSVPHKPQTRAEMQR